MNQCNFDFDVSDEPPEPPRFCSCCNQKIRKLNPHRMDRQKVKLLVRLLELGHFAEESWVKISTGNQKQITGDAAVLALRLCWFGLAEHGPMRSGLFRITDLGKQFLAGVAQVPEVIWCRDSKVVERSSTLVSIGSIKNVVLDKDYWNSYPNIQRNDHGRGPESRPN